MGKYVGKRLLFGRFFQVAVPRKEKIEVSQKFPGRDDDRENREVGRLLLIGKKGTYVIKSFRSLGFFRPPKAILVPGMYFFGFSR